MVKRPRTIIRNFLLPFTLFSGSFLLWSSTSASVFLPGVQHVWNFDGDSTDAVGSFDGTDFNITYTDGKFVQAAAFNGSDSYINIGNTSGLPLGGAASATISVWIKYSTITSDNGQQIIFDYGGDQTNRVLLGFNSENLYIEYGSRDNNISARTLPGDGQWHNIILTYGGSLDPNIRLYLDGSLVGTCRISYVNIPDFNRFHVGTYFDQTSRYSFSGLIDDLVILNDQIFDADVAKIWNDGVGNQILPLGTYEFGGFLEPIEAGSAYKLGRNLPVKFQLTGADGQFVSTASAKLFVAEFDNGVAGMEAPAISSGSSNSGNNFRYDPADDQYIFNLDTHPLSAGIWRLRATLDDKTSHTVLISLK